jgi:hypothetical protein
MPFFSPLAEFRLLANRKSCLIKLSRGSVAASRLCRPVPKETHFAGNLRKKGSENAFSFAIGRKDWQKLASRPIYVNITDIN